MFSHPMLELPMALAIIRRMIPLAQPCRLRIRHLAQRAQHRRGDLLLLTVDSSDLQTSVSGREEHLVAMETKKRVGRVFACDVRVCEDCETAGMEVRELGEVEDFGVDNDPEITFFVVLVVRKGSERC